MSNKNLGLIKRWYPEMLRFQLIVSGGSQNNKR
ncbi:MAG: hypothetical protein ACJAWH_001535 [Maribacter sp.]|jgi:hypothetical protein